MNICVKSIVCKIEDGLIKESKIFKIPDTVYENFVKELTGRGNASGIFCTLKCVPPDAAKGFFSGWLKDGEDLKNNKYTKMICSNLLPQGVSFYTRCIQVYWSFEENILALEENMYED